MTVPEHDYGGGVFDAIDTGLILLDGDRRVVGWNAWMAGASGIATAAARGRRLDEAVSRSRFRRASTRR